MPQCKQPHIYETTHPDWVASTVQLRRDLRITVTETTCFADAKPRGKNWTPQPEKRRECVLHVYKGAQYHALIDTAKKSVMLFVPYKGWLESVDIPLSEVSMRTDRTEEAQNYLKWGNKKTDTVVEVV